MAELKTKMNDAPVEKYISSIKDKSQQEDSFVLLKLMKECTGEQPKMWGSSIVGFGIYHYKVASGREGDWFVTGFSARKQNMTVYFCTGFQKLQPYIRSLGKCKTTMGCLYFKKLADIDISVLKHMLKQNKKDLAAVTKQKKQ